MECDHREMQETRTRHELVSLCRSRLRCTPSLRIHLAALLRAMIYGGLCTREEVREFVVALEDDALGLSET
jgi:hypothetical protein